MFDIAVTFCQFETKSLWIGVAQEKIQNPPQQAPRELLGEPRVPRRPQAGECKQGIFIVDSLIHWKQGK